jgi:integrase/recombinase XerD
LEQDIGQYLDRRNENPKPFHWKASVVEILRKVKRAWGVLHDRYGAKKPSAALASLDTNPAHAVRGPKYSQKKGKTPVLDREEARALLAAIDTGSLTGLRDRALIGVMVYTFARIGAVLQMKVGDYFSQGRRGWVRLHEKGGKEHQAPCIPKLESFLDDYVASAGIASDKDGPLFRTTGRSTGTPRRMTQQDAYRMIQRYARRAGIKTRIGNHSMRATGITDYLKSDGSLAEARKMVNHAYTRTTQLYDRRADAASLEEYGKVGI